MYTLVHTEQNISDNTVAIYLINMTTLFQLSVSQDHKVGD